MASPERDTGGQLWPIVQEALRATVLDVVEGCATEVELLQVHHAQAGCSDSCERCAAFLEAVAAIRNIALRRSKP